MRTSNILMALACGFVFASPSFLSAQFAQNHALYFSGEGNVGNYYGIDANVNYIYKEKFSLKAGYSAYVRRPRSQPEDYTSGLIETVLLFGLVNPRDKLQNLHMDFGWLIMLNQSRTLRLNASVGFGYTKITEPKNWERRTGGFLIENYSWEYNSSDAFSLILNPKIEFPFTRVFGLSVSPLMIINKERTYYGIGFGLMLGLLRT